MAVDVHAHYVPREIVQRLETEGARLGISIVETQPGCQQLRFAYGLEVRPFFAKLVEEPARRIAGMASAGIDRQILSVLRVVSLPSPCISPSGGEGIGIAPSPSSRERVGVRVAFCSRIVRARRDARTRRGVRPARHRADAVT
jgi:hypothetical protein